MDLRCEGVLIEQQALGSSGNFIPETPAKSASKKRNLVSFSNGEGTPAFESLVDIPVVLRCPLTEKSGSTSSNKIANPPFAPITPSKVRSAQHCKTQEVVHLYTEDVHKKERVNEFEDRTDASSSSEEDEETQEIDLNKIPRKKMARRKKIRPKVIQEGKQIKSPRPVTPKIAEPKEKPITKKTYVRRKKALNYSEIPFGSTEKNQKNAIPLKTYVRKRKILNPSETPLTKIREEVIKTADQLPKNTTKSVRRSLNFGSEGEAIDECHVSSACGIESAAFEPFNCNPKICSREFYVELAQGMEVRVTKSPVGFAFDLNRSLNEVLDEYIKLPEDPAPSAQTTENGMNVLNDQKQVSSCTHKDVIIIDDDDDEDEKIEVKRDRDHISVVKHCFIQESLIPRDVCFVHGYKETKQTRSCQVTSSLSPYLPIIYKRRRTQKPKLLRSLSSEDAQWSRNFDMLHQLELTFGPTQRATRKRSTLQGRKRIPIAGAEDCEHLLWCPENENCEPQACMDTLFADTRFKITTKRRRSRGHFGFVSSALLNTKQDCEIDSSQFSFSLQPFVLGLAASTRRRWKYLKRIQVCSKIPTVVTCLDPVDVIVEKMKHMKIGHAQLKTICEAGNALVPYGGNSTLVPHMHLFDMIKKQRPRAKVNLDPETNRVWNLLMGKKSYTEADGVDVDKEKWWEGEREVFRGRADAFIARMHLILGDRRFSKWNGSVVDSVVGVFLTQNVSDHLSSSAFMSLAARFPLRSRGNSREGNEKRIDTSTEREDGSISSLSDTEAIDPGSMGASEKENEPTDAHGSLGSNNRNGMDYSKDNDFHTNRHENEIGPNQALQNKMLTMITDLQIIDLEEAEDRMTPEDVVSSSTECFGKENIGVLNEGIGPCSLSCASEITELYDINIMGSDIGQQTTTMGVGSYEPRSKLSIHALTCLNTEVCLGKHVTCQGNLPNEKIDDLLRKYDSQELPQVHDEQPVEIQKEKIDINFQSENIHHEVYMEETAYPSSCNYIEGTPETVMASEIILKNEVHNSQNAEPQEVKNASRTVKVNAKADKTKMFDWEDLRKEALDNDNKNERSREAMDSLDWEAVREADVNEISKAIRERGMNNVLAGRIKEFLNRLVKDHGSIDLEWLRNVPPDKAKEYLLSIHGLGLKSVECVRLLTLQHLAFPVDTNVGRICVRLGWVPLQPLPESLQLHLLELYPMIEHIQKYLWPRLCTLDQRTLYELHYQMITFGKVFCTKTKPNCNACPMRGECKHFASAFASARLALPGLEEKRLVSSRIPSTFKNDGSAEFGPIPLPQLEGSQLPKGNTRNDEPIIEEPDSPEPICAESLERDIEDAFFEDSEEIPTIKLSLEDFKENLKNYMQENNMEIQDGEMSKALVAITAEATSIPMPKLKNVNRLRTEHQVYELPDSHPLLQGMDERVPDDPCPYLLAIWTPGETAQSTGPPQSCCNFQDSSKLCGRKTCFACNSIQEAEAQTVRGTLLIPCRTAMRGSFPLNGTYFQVNEVFADHTSSRIPINVPREWIWNLSRRTVFFGTSVSTIFKGLTLEEIQHCFWRGFVCVRGFDQASRAPRPLYARLHFPPSKAVKTKQKASTNEDKGGTSSKIL